MPADAFPFPVFVSGQQKLIHSFESVLEFPNNLFLVFRHHVKRLEIGVGVDTEICPFLTFLRRRNLTGIVRQIAHMAHGGLHAVALGEETTDGACLRGALDDDQCVRHGREVTVPFFIAPTIHLQRKHTFFPSRRRPDSATPLKSSDQV